MTAGRMCQMLLCVHCTFGGVGVRGGITWALIFCGAVVLTCQRHKGVVQQQKKHISNSEFGFCLRDVFFFWYVLLSVDLKDQSMFDIRL